MVDRARGAPAEPTVSEPVTVLVAKLPLVTGLKVAVILLVPATPNTSVQVGADPSAARVTPVIHVPVGAGVTLVVYVTVPCGTAVPGSDAATVVENVTVPFTAGDPVVLKLVLVPSGETVKLIVG